MTSVIDPHSRKLRSRQKSSWWSLDMLIQESQKVCWATPSLDKVNFCVSETKSGRTMGQRQRWSRKVPCSRSGKGGKVREGWVDECNLAAVFLGGRLSVPVLGYLLSSLWPWCAGMYFAASLEIRSLASKPVLFECRAKSRGSSFWSLVLWKQYTVYRKSSRSLWHSRKTKNSNSSIWAQNCYFHVEHVNKTTNWELLVFSEKPLLFVATSSPTWHFQWCMLSWTGGNRMNPAKSSRQVAREHLQLGAKKQRQRHGMEAAALGYWHLHGFKGMIHRWFPLSGPNHLQRCSQLVDFRRTPSALRQSTNGNCLY